MQRHLRAAAAVLLWLCVVGEDDCELDQIEESEVQTLKTQLLQQKLQLARQNELEVPSGERFSLPLARAYAALSQAAFCGVDEALRNWTCEACHAVGFSLAPGSTRLVRQAELGEADSTFIFAARLRYLDGQRLWPSARPAEPLQRRQQDCWGHCGSRGGYCDWCGVGNACCRQGEAGDPAECFNATGFSGAEQHECVQVQSPVPKVPVQHEDEDCWIYCGKAGGFCDWCGGGNACCKFGYDADPVECRGAAKVMDQMKYNISSPELRDLETEVVSVLKKRITFKKRPDDHPFSFLIYQCKSKTEDALAKALGIPDGHAKPSVIMRPFSPGTRPVVSKVLAVDPGNDLEAVVDVEALSGETLDKLALPETLKSFDQALQDAVSEDFIMKDLLNLHPALAMEYSSASLAGDYVSMGWHTVCRRDKADTTLDGYGTSQIVNDQTLNSCSAMCNNWKSYCYGFEFRTREKRCEIWTAPICYHTEAPPDISGSSFVDFRCFKRCQ